MELILLLGCTSSGKSEMAVQLAQKLNNSVIVSCDSRQVYKGLNLLSGKIDGDTQPSQYSKLDCFFYKGIEHFLIDNVKLDIDYNLSEYIKDYIQLVNGLQNVDYIILTGGTGLYARAIYDNYQLSKKIQNIELNNLSLIELQSQLNQYEFNNSDWNNRVRLVNKLSVMDTNLIKTIYPQYTKKTKYIIKVNKELIANKVCKRINDRLESGMIEELKFLVNQYGYSKFMTLGLESRYCSYYLLGFINYQQLIYLMNYQTMQYVKRQLTWLNKEKDVIWIDCVEDIKILD